MKNIQKIGLFVIIGVLIIGFGLFFFQKTQKESPKNETPVFNTPLTVTSKDLPTNEE